MKIKNIKRTYNEYFKNNINSKIFPWIEINNNKLGNEYYQILVDGNILNVQKKIKGRKVGLPDPCGNTPMICLPEDRIQCVEGIYKKYSYLFIKGNELLCIEHIKERLYY